MFEILALKAALPGLLVALFVLLAARRSSRRDVLALEHLREEVMVMLSQQQTEYLDGLEDLRRGLSFLEESGKQTETAMREGLTPSLRSRAIQLMRSGLSPDAAASTLAMPKSDLRLIATVSRVLSSDWAS